MQESTVYNNEKIEKIQRLIKPEIFRLTSVTSFWYKKDMRNDAIFHKMSLKDMQNYCQSLFKNGMLEKDISVSWLKKLKV